MDPSTVAVTGVSGLLGQRLLHRLDGAGHRIVGLDTREPSRRVQRLEHHRVDIAGQDLEPLLQGVDVVVHLAAVVDPIADDALMARVNVEGTRRVLDAAAAVGVRKLVRMSTAAVYGAWATNPLPLTEDAPLRPNPGFGPAVQGAEVERLLYEWQQEHPDVIVTALRAAPILGAGATHLWARLLTSPTRPRVRGESAPVQVAHADDVAAALALMVEQDHPGVFNIASDGWLSYEDAAALVPRALLPALPAEVLSRGLTQLWTGGIADIPPGVVPYLVHPWAVASDRLQALGWTPTHTNEETILETLDAQPPSNIPSARTLAFVGGATLAGAAVMAAGVVLKRLRR